MAAVNPIPDNYPRLTPYLHVDGAKDAIDWYSRVLGGTVRGGIMEAPGGKVGHCELEFGDSVVMLADEYPDMGALGPKAIGGTPVTLHLYVDDVDAVADLAVREGAKLMRPVEDAFYGDRITQIEDPFGHQWSIASHIEEVSPEEMGRRAAVAMKEMGAG